MAIFSLTRPWNQNGWKWFPLYLERAFLVSRTLINNWQRYTKLVSGKLIICQNPRLPRQRDEILQKKNKLQTLVLSFIDTLIMFWLYPSHPLTSRLETNFFQWYSKHWIKLQSLYYHLERLFNIETVEPPNITEPLCFLNFACS